MKNTDRLHVVFWRWYGADAVWGGAEAQLLSYLERLDPDRARATILANVDLFGSRIEAQGLPADVVLYDSYHEASRLQQGKAIVEMIRRLRPDRLVVVQGSFRDFLLGEFIVASCAQWPQLLRPVEYHMSAPTLPSTARGRWHGIPHSLELRGRMASKVVAVSNEAKRRMVEWYNYPSDSVQVIHHGIDLRRFTFTDEMRQGIRERVRGELGIPRDATVIISTARFSPEKHLDWVADSCAALSRSWPSLHWVFVGDGPMRREIEGRLRSAASCAGRVHFIGFVPDVSHYLLASDIFVLASEIEGLSNAMLEAMAAGLVTICTRTPGTEDVIQHGVNGMIAEISPDSIHALLESAVQLAPSARAQMQSAAGRTVPERFDVRMGINRAMQALGLPVRSDVS